jgi:hypothetical protein
MKHKYKAGNVIIHISFLKVAKSLFQCILLVSKEVGHVAKDCKIVG